MLQSCFNHMIASTCQSLPCKIIFKKTDITKAAMLTYYLCPASVSISWLLVSIELCFISVHSAQFRLRIVDLCRFWCLIDGFLRSPHICTNKFAPTVLVHFLKNDVIQFHHLLNVMFLVSLCSASFGVEQTEKMGKLKLVTRQACSSLSWE